MSYNSTIVWKNTFKGKVIPGLVDAYQDMFDQIAKTLGRNISVQAELSTSAKGDNFVTCQMTSEDDKVGYLARLYSPDKGILDNELLHLYSNYQGKGLADIINNTGIKILESFDGRHVTFEANLDVGGYAWLRKGIVPDQDHLQNVFNNYSFYYPGVIPKEEVARIESFLAMSHEERMAYVLTDEFSKDFKNIFLGSQWNVEIDFTKNPHLRDLMTSGKYTSDLTNGATTASQAILQAKVAVAEQAIKAGSVSPAIMSSLDGWKKQLNKFVQNTSTKPASVNKLLSSSFVTMTANFSRLAEGELQVVRGFLKDLEHELINKLNDNPKLTEYTKARYEALINQGRSNIHDVYDTIGTQHNKFLGEVIGLSTSGTSKAFGGIGIPLDSVALTTEQMRAMASNAMIEGAPSAAWWAKQDNDLQLAFAQQLRIGMAAGETLAQLVTRVRGEATGIKQPYIINGKVKWYNEFKGGLLDTGTKQAAALVRTSTMQVASDARMDMFKQNSDILKGWQWVSTLDTRTSQICQAHDALIYDFNNEPIGHGVPVGDGGPPPAHFSCRSTMVPVVRGFEEMGADPKVDDDWLDALGEGTRASMDGQVPEKMTFDDWFKTRTEADQRAMLGNAKFELYQKHGLTMTEMLDQKGNPLTVFQLAQMYDYPVDIPLTAGMPSIPEEVTPGMGVEELAQELAEDMARRLAEEERLAALLVMQVELENLIKEVPYASTIQEQFELAGAWTGDIQKDLAALQAGIAQQKASQDFLRDIENAFTEKLSYYRGKGDILHVEYILAKEQQQAFKQAFQFTFDQPVFLPKDMQQAYEQSLSTLQEQNKQIKQDLMNMAQEKPWLASYIDMFSSDPAHYMPWDMEQTMGSFQEMIDDLASDAYDSFQELAQQEGLMGKAAANQALLAMEEKGFSMSDKSAYIEALDQAQNALQDIQATENAVLEELSGYKQHGALQEEAFKQIESTHGQDWAKSILPSEFKLQVEQAAANLEKAAKEYIGSITLDDPLFDFALKKGIKSSDFASKHEFSLALQELAKEMQGNMTVIVNDVYKEVAGTLPLDGSVVTYLDVPYDLSNPATLKHFNQKKDVLLAKYKQDVMTGKTPSKSVVAMYDSLTGAAKDAFDTQLKLAMEPPKESTANALPDMLNFGTMDRVGPQMGSNQGGVFRDRETGIEYYVKFPVNADIAKNEVLAGKLYQAAGVKVPEVTFVMDGSTLGVASRMEAGIVSLKGAPGAATKLANAYGALENFGVDAWLGNWDVIGLEYDNMVLTNTGLALRLDQGGALLFRAQGTLKGTAFGSKVDELKSLLTPSTNIQTSKVFKNMTQTQLESGVKQVLGLSNAKIKEIVESVGMDKTTTDKLVKTLIDRKKDLAQQFPHLVKKGKGVGTAALSKPVSVDWEKAKTGQSAHNSAHRREDVSEDSINDLINYTGALSSRLNSFLRAGADNYYKNLVRKGDTDLIARRKVEELLAMQKSIDNAFVNQYTTNDIVTLRGVGLEPDRIKGLSDILQQFATGDRSGTFSFGDYLSTSTSDDVAYNFSAGNTLFEVRLPKGTKAMSVKDISQHRIEQEILVDRNTRFRIISHQKKTLSPEKFGARYYGHYIILEAIV